MTWRHRSRWLQRTGRPGCRRPRGDSSPPTSSQAARARADACTPSARVRRLPRRGPTARITVASGPGWDHLASLDERFTRAWPTTCSPTTPTQPEGPFPVDRQRYDECSSDSRRDRGRTVWLGSGIASRGIRGRCGGNGGAVPSPGFGQGTWRRTREESDCRGSQPSCCSVTRCHGRRFAYRSGRHLHESSLTEQPDGRNVLVRLRGGPWPRNWPGLFDTGIHRAR